ncbi:MAG: TRAP transporter substrate-binding protein [Rhodospirillaceae bacterium]|nr:TRAP transporter substrate-binding protein [Rhodospirillaceae bacterium]
MKMESVFAPAKSTRGKLWVGALMAGAVAAALGLAAPAEAQTRTLNMQSSWPANSTAQEAFKMFADRVDKMTGGQLKITTSPAGTVVPAFEVLDATHKKVLDGTHTISYYWIGKNKAATLFSNTPAGIVGMDQMDFIGWLYEGGGLDLYWEFYQKELKLNLVVFPLHAPSPQALGWFRKPITGLADFKGMKCRQTGITAELYARMGMAVVNMPGGEIAPAAERGAIDCAEWVGGIEDYSLGLHLIWKNHYTPGMHESASVGEMIINKDVWDSLTAPQREIIKSATSETLLRWGVMFQRMNAEAIEEMTTKHGVTIRTTPKEINEEFLRVWDKVAAEESAKSPFFKKVYDSQKAYAGKVVPAKRFMFPPYTTQADHYFPLKSN